MKKYIEIKIENSTILFQEDQLKLYKKISDIIKGNDTYHLLTVNEIIRKKQMTTSYNNEIKQGEKSE